MQKLAFALVCLPIAGCGDEGGGASAGSDGGETATPTASTSGGDTTAAPGTTGAADSSGSGPGSGEVGSEGSGAGSTGEPDGMRRIYLNYEGVEITEGPDDAITNTSSVLSGSFEPFGGGLSVTQEIRITMQEHWAAFDVEVVDERPASGPYIMVVVTPTNTLKGGGTAVGPLDCGDAVKSDIVFVFTNDDPNALNIAVRASGRVGTSLGVSNSVSNTDLSSASIGFPGMAKWTDDCIPADPPPDVCSKGALAHCDTADEHNPFQIILDALGPA